MRVMGLWGAAALLLAGCDSGTVIANESTGNAAPPPVSRPAPAPAAPAPSVPPRPTPTIPEAFHGVYDGSIEGCERPSDQRLTVSASELRFHESIGSVRRVAAEPSGAIRVEADYQGEGERWRSSRDLRLSADGARLTISGDGTSLTRIRCPQGEL